MSSAAEDPDYEGEMPPPKKKQRIAASDVPSGTSSALEMAAVRQITEAQKRDHYDGPWAYTSKQIDVITKRSKAKNLDLVADQMWAQTAWQITARRYVNARTGGTKLFKRCVVTNDEDAETESAHLVRARREKLDDVTVFQGQIDLLRQAQVVPDDAHINAQANRMQLIKPVHRDLDSRLVDLFPHQGQVIARLLCETKYQEERVAASSSGTKSEAPANLPARPPFELFYAAAEKQGACFRLIASNRKQRPSLVRANQDGSHTDFALEGVAPDDPLRLLWSDAQKPPPGAPILPPFVVPVSTNLLIWAMHDRLRRPPPSHASLRHEASILAQLVDLLLEFWFINDSIPATEIAELAARARVFVRDYGGAEWSQQLSNLGTVDYSDIVKGATLPDNALRSQDPPPTSEERALMLEAAAATHSDDEDDDDADLPSLDFPEPHLPPQLGIVPSHPLTTAALKSFEMQQLRNSGKSTSLPGSGEKLSTPSLSPPTSSSISTCSPSLPAPVLDAVAVRAHPGKRSLISSFAPGGPYPFEATGPHPV
ncbi:proteophosphoglycan ppg4 [Rhodotorula toruloides]|uniref:Proteophosphoglycan ppg4 n=1 Tax=Rhodotorula toruloides TaxID=5286 RepID=A0A511KR64_RHOTO|nr:proteophosphoglycan ppg4 [Rhodotorula toruloides]